MHPMNSPIQLPPNAWKKGVAIPFVDGNFPIESIPFIYYQTTDEPIKRLAEEFSFFGDTKNLSKMTPHVCRKGCKYYEPVGDPESGNFREFCKKSNGTMIGRDKVCENFESKVRLSEVVLTF